MEFLLFSYKRLCTVAFGIWCLFFEVNYYTDSLPPAEKTCFDCPRKNGQSKMKFNKAYGTSIGHCFGVFGG